MMRRRELASTGELGDDRPSPATTTTHDPQHELASLRPRLSGHTRRRRPCRAPEDSTRINARCRTLAIFFTDGAVSELRLVNTLAVAQIAAELKTARVKPPTVARTNRSRSIDD